MLKLEDINKKVGDFSLRNIGFTVRKGDYFVLIGETGAGKSAAGCTKAVGRITSRPFKGH